MSLPIAFPPPPSTSNVRSSKKLSRVDDTLCMSTRLLSRSQLTLPTNTATNNESAWLKRKPTVFRLSPSTTSLDALDSPASLTYHRRGSVLSVAPSIISNAPSTASGSSASDVPSDTTQRRTKLERLRRKLGEEVPATAVFCTTPRTAVPRTPKTATSTTRSSRGRTRSIARTPAHIQADDARSLSFSISSDESIHRVTLSARVQSPHPPRTRHKHMYQTGALPPVPPIPAHLASLSSSSTARCDDDDAGLVRPRQKVAAGSKIGGSDFKAARRAKREGRLAEPGEMMEMVGFLW
ncbi:hypothetical protein L210DRAFT_3112617 [Boletus edulis BED1]|uniref:Uncharacterized protein n=1 Tax=Boletus edulis BED1 TaxID=1328754 RepID=A0AAD4BZC9_BOLED|nr:hypothetical protein L210DRAFT_3112617 [Boletus edulis BED1]